MYKLGENKEQMMMMMRDMKKNSGYEAFLGADGLEVSPLQNLQHHSTMGGVSPPPSNSLEAPLFEDQQQQPKFHHYGLWLDPKGSPNYRNKNADENKSVDDGFGLYENLYQMHIRDEERDGGNSGQMRRFGRDSDGLGFSFGHFSAYNAEKYGSYEGFNKGYQSSPQQVSLCLDGGDVIRSTLLGLQEGYEKGDSFGSYSIGYNQSNDLSSLPTSYDNQRNYLLEQRMDQGRGLDSGGILMQSGFSTRPYIGNPFVCSVDGNGGRAAIDSLSSSPRFWHSKIPLEENVVEDHRVTIQGRGFKYDIDNKGLNSIKYRNKKPLKGIAMQNLQERSSKHDKMHGENVTLMPSPYSLLEFHGCIYYMAKDQKGCRFLQRIFDEGSCLDVQIIFNEVIGNIVELMMDPFGNYLVQKLLDVCTEEQRLQIVLTVTKEPGQLVRISLNTYGTRVVQKLIETLKSRQQISHVKSALKPGILDLVKDLNGNHVLQRCLQCLDNEDNKIIFDAAAKFCVDIATHRHGCCVLQRCIAHSNGQHREKLITQISRNGLLLAQDPFGNYVVQYIIELKVVGNLLSQFKGHYVHLSMQKFSSHVVEKCLKHFAESRSQIIRELISVVHFEQLLQDPFANYVIQSALAITKGPLHASLVEAVQPHTILRTSPYCKRIFSRNLLKK
ncbi:pumilio domain-containing protein 7-like [Hibiscus syriacus]|nr:pumilio domain-containing protein 7-like [Hibiscus syriacus]